MYELNYEWTMTWIAIMNRSRFRSQFLKNRSVECWMKYNKQRNIYVA